MTAAGKDPVRPRAVAVRIVVVAIVLAAAGAGIHLWRTGMAPSAGGDDRVLYGNVDIREVALAFEVPGRIDRIAVDEGDPLTRGQVVASLAADAFRHDRDQAAARLAQREAELARLRAGTRPEEIDQARAVVNERTAAVENAREEYDRQRQLLRQGHAAQSIFDRARAALREAEARLVSARAALHLAEIGSRAEDITAAAAVVAAERATLAQAERRLGETVLTAPADGTVLTRVREPGAVVQAGQTVLSEALAEPLWVRAYVSEPDLGRIRPGQSVHILTDSAPGTAYTGRIGFISPQAEFTPKAVETEALRSDLVYRLRIIVDPPAPALRQGMPVTVRPIPPA